MLLKIHQSRWLKVSPEGDHEEDNRMLYWDPLVKFLQPQIYLNTFACFSTNLVCPVHVVLNVLLLTNTLVCKVKFTVVPEILYVVSFRKFFFKICFLKFII